MEYKETRIGNLVNFKPNYLNPDKFCKIEGNISYNHSFVTEIKTGKPFTLLRNALHPIELTEEWLLKLGFKPFVKDFTLKGIIIHKRKRGWVLRKSVPEIKYVHQLQNLYFALKGEELELK